MSKMRMPEMSVVRFTESDVIVASKTLQTVGLYQFANHQPNDAYITTEDGTFSHTSSPSFVDAERLYSNLNNNTKFYWDVTDEEFGQANWSQLLGYDSSTVAQGNSTDGTYTYRTDGAGNWGFYLDTAHQ